MINPMDMTGKQVIVAGASSGIGRQTAVTLSLLGARLILIARREDKLQETLGILEDSGHCYYCADLSLIDKIKILFQRIADEHGAIDGMVYAAGISTSIPLAQFSPKRVQSVLDINFLGFLECVRQICKRGRYNEKMRIVGISSVASSRGDKSHTVYSASKAAMESAVRCIAKEMAHKGICINTVAPAMTATGMYSQYLATTDDITDVMRQNLLARQYLGIIQPEDVAYAIAFLLSPASRMLTGITLPVDGGLTVS